jgi:hypothetical protein
MSNGATGESVFGAGNRMQGRSEEDMKPETKRRFMMTQPGARFSTPELVLCPGCCTIDDVARHHVDPQALAPLVGCARCSFTFPILPGEFADLTLEAMHRHRCHVSGGGDNYEGVAQEIIKRVNELGLNQSTLLERARHLNR